MCGSVVNLLEYLLAMMGYSVEVQTLEGVDQGCQVFNALSFYAADVVTASANASLILSSGFDTRITPLVTPVIATGVDGVLDIIALGILRMRHSILPR